MRPDSPNQISAFLPAGVWITGVNDAYKFEIHHPAGAITRVERHWDPVPIQPDHAAYAKQWRVDGLREDFEDFTWNGPPIPDFKPAYASFQPTYDHRFLVVSEGPSHRVEPCDERYEDRGSSYVNCYEPERVWSMFDMEGTFLGEITRPPGRLYQPFVRNDLVLLNVEDDYGTITVKRYRMVLPG